MLKERVATASVLLICLLLVAFLFNELAFFVFIAGVSMLAAYEWAGLVGYANKFARISYGLAFLGILVFSRSIFPEALVPILLFSICFWFLAFICILSYPHSGRIWNRRPLLFMLGLIVIYPTSYALLYLYNSDYFAYRFLGLFLFVGAADTGAYFAGKSFGRHKLAESVSPNKTWEGVLGGLISCTLISLIYCYLFHYLMNKPFPLLFALCCPLLVSTFSVTGDLFESMLKRVRGIKDSGDILPGHGGILDRIDGIVAALPVYLLSTVFFL
jgi:phosphatidate cytidylyltransferase